jgi:hypothetical protein
MRIVKPVLIALAAIVLIIGIHASAGADERFGPWVYYAPYYFPPDSSCFGHLLSPADYVPRYESPLPPKPSYGGDCCNPSMPLLPPPPKMARHAPRGVHGAAPKAVLSPHARANQSPVRSSLRPVNQSGAVAPKGPRAVNHPGPQGRIVPAQGNVNQAQ